MLIVRVISQLWRGLMLSASAIVASIGWREKWSRLIFLVDHGGRDWNLRTAKVCLKEQATSAIIYRFIYDKISTMGERSL